MDDMHNSSSQLAATGKDRTSSLEWADCLDRLAPRRMSMASIICALLSGSCSAITLHSNHSQNPARALGGADILKSAPVWPSETQKQRTCVRLASDVTISEMFFNSFQGCPGTIVGFSPEGLVLSFLLFSVSFNS